MEEIEEQTTDDRIIIASKRLEVYNQLILDMFQKFDQIEVQVLDTYIDRAIYIVRLWEAMGVFPVDGKIVFRKVEEEIKTREGKVIKKYINKIKLSKIPELFRFTNN